MLVMKQKLFYSFPVRTCETHFLFLQSKHLLKVCNYYTPKYVLGSSKQTVRKNLVQSF